MNQPALACTMSALSRQLAEWRAGGMRIGLVPTMGALHAGHLSLVDQAAAACDRVVVSIFVNPAQFAPHEDFASYPRTLQSDRAKLAGTGMAGLIFAPNGEQMYPPGFATAMSLSGPALGLESESRPHFFGGVAIIVAKLLIAVMPDVAVFGEKDYQQLLVVRRMAADLGLPIRIDGGAIIREADGLAMSSRNAYLAAGERRVAGGLNTILKTAIAQLRDGAPIAAVEAGSRAALIAAGFDSIDYVTVRDAETLAPVTDLSRPARILAAAKIGKTRLIDNMAV